jgi:hypothetical protein
MQNWKRVAIFGAIGAGAALFLAGRRPLGAALTAGGLALLASEYPEKFEGLLEDAPDYLNKGVELLTDLTKVGATIFEGAERRSSSFLGDLADRFGD